MALASHRFHTSLPRPATDRPAPWTTARTLPVWLVTVPTRSAGGATGTQSFAVRAPTQAQAITAAAAHAADSSAVLHRRGARLDVAAARATPWTGL